MCPICGKPVPASKGVKPRKYCSSKCATRASHEGLARRGYKRPKNYSKVCVICGKGFVTDRAGQECCSKSCAGKLTAQIRGQSLRMSARVREEQKCERRARLAKRDLDYAESGCTAPVTVEVRGNVVTEWRGQRCIAPHFN